jgi:hypothetical protein
MAFAAGLDNSCLVLIKSRGVAFLLKYNLAIACIVLLDNWNSHPTQEPDTLWLIAWRYTTVPSSPAVYCDEIHAAEMCLKRHDHTRLDYIRFCSH